jgi:hypothetical protein
MLTLRLTILPDGYAICRLAAGDPLPSWISPGNFFSITRTGEELSIICPQVNLPSDVQHQPGWRIIKFEGPFEFSQIGVLASVALPLAESGVSLLTISTYDTDYILVQAEKLNMAIQALETAGHSISYPGDTYVSKY